MKRDNTAAGDLFISSDESTSGTFEKAITDASANRISVARLVQSAKNIKPSDIERAVYAHIRAIRVLGKKSVNTAEIAEALGISLDEVHGALGALKKKGVKVL